MLVIRRLALLAALLLLLLLAAGFAYEWQARRTAVRAHPAPGTLVDVGGRSLHVRCAGKGFPAVVVETGSGSWSLDWREAQELLAEDGRVCVYDRAGYGWSDPASEPPTPERLADDLRHALDGVGVDEPFVLMGHSLGGLYARSYALRRPGDVLALVLVDARHEDAAQALPASVVRQEGHMRRVYRLAQEAARFGLPRLLGPALLSSSGLPEEDHDAFVAGATHAGFFRTVRGEILALPAVERAVRGSRHDVPVVVVRHGLPGMFAGTPEPEAAEDAWRSLQEDLATLSDATALLVAHGSGHNVQLERPEVLVEAVRTARRLALP